MPPSSPATRAACSRPTSFRCVSEWPCQRPSRFQSVSPWRTRRSVVTGRTRLAVPMDLGLSGKRCLVTGSTAGIGLATARMLVAEGAHVTVTGRDADRVEHARADAGAAKGIPADLSKPDEANRLVAEAGPIDCLVNNVGEAY